MIIKEVTKRIHFLAYNPDKKALPKEEESPTVVVNTKYSNIVFGKHVLRETQMAGKFVRFYYEPQRKIIGWQLAEQVNQAEMKLWKVCIPNKSTGVWNVGIGKMLKEMRLKEGHSYTALPVQKYREKALISEHKNDVFYFVEVKDKDTADEPEKTDTTVSETTTTK